MICKFIYLPNVQTAFLCYPSKLFKNRIICRFESDIDLVGLE